MKPLDECLYYLVRADGGGIPEKDIYFNDALKGLFLPEKLPEKWTEKYLEKTLEKWVDILQKV